MIEKRKNCADAERCAETVQMHMQNFVRYLVQNYLQNAVQFFVQIAVQKQGLMTAEVRHKE